MKTTDVLVEPCVISFRYPWADDFNDVNGLAITRIISPECSSPIVYMMDPNTPKPDYPMVACVSVARKRIGDFRIQETSTWIPLL